VEPYLPKPYSCSSATGPWSRLWPRSAVRVDYTVEAVGAGAGPDALDHLALTPRARWWWPPTARWTRNARARPRDERGYVSLVASRKRAAVVAESFASEGCASNTWAG